MANGGWKVLVVLGATQFLMVLDQAVMNVSISQLVADFDTEVTTIQAVITTARLPARAPPGPAGRAPAEAALAGGQAR
jgi:hypothetical protein